MEPFYRRDDPTAPDKLSHYTSLASAQNILASGEIRASDAFYLNDGSEVSYGAGLIAERLKGEPSILSRLHEHFDIAARSGPDSRILRSVRSLRMYVFSLSEKGDLLSQWRAYGGSGGGVAIGFNRAKLPSLRLDEPHQIPQPEVFPLIYDHELQGRVVDSVVETARDISGRLALGVENKQVFLQDAAGQLCWTSLLFKNPAFFEEQEWRLLFMGVPDATVKFRVGRQGLIPYAEIPFDRRIVTKVVQGPLLDPAIGEGALERFLDSEGYSHALPIERSRIPLRAL